MCVLILCKIHPIITCTQACDIIIGASRSEPHIIYITHSIQENHCTYVMFTVYIFIIIAGIFKQLRFLIRKFTRQFKLLPACFKLVLSIHSDHHSKSCNVQNIYRVYILHIPELKLCILIRIDICRYHKI